MTTAVAFESVDGTNTYKIALAATGPTTASVDIRTWVDSHQEPSAPDHDLSLNLTGVHVAGGVIMCSTHVLFETADICIWISAANMLPSVTVDVSHTWFNNSSKTYNISKADHDAMLQFVQTAGFPKS